MKKIICLFLLLLMFICCGYRKPDKYTINASQNAFYHNNLGLNYLRDRIYYAAIEEFKIAITLSPNTQATAVFKNNLGKTYMYIGYPDLAKVCFEDALKLYGLNFQYYVDLVKCYQELNLAQIKIAEYKVSENLYDRIMLGLLYIQTGETRRGIVILDDICSGEPDLLITPAIKQYLSDITKNL